MWTAPVPQEFFDGLIGSLASICPACCCGWWPLAKMVFRDASSKHASDLYRPMGPTDCLAPWIDRSYHLSPFAAPAQPVDELADRLISLGGERRCHRHPRAVVTFAR